MSIETMNQIIEEVLGEATENTLYITETDGKLMLNDYNNRCEISKNISEDELKQMCLDQASALNLEVFV